ncbi:MAG TPA: SafA/ExsA family spore coat assembly protein [Bacillus bacterium]|nr:SafA/ExsA family spore coat assembly protein [Bacillus sp. (in: firmicutes)]
MKIHIVQKGDTLWKIAQKYGVDFNELKSVNSQLSNPDMIMPGMKIKIPTGSVPVVKKEHPMAPHMPIAKEMPIVKEMPQQILPTPIQKEMPIPPMPVEQEIDYNIEQKMYNYTFNVPTFPTIPYMPIKEAAPKKVKEAPVKEMPVPCPEPEVMEEFVPPTMPAQPMPCPPCVPVTGVLPGSGLPCGYYPVPVSYSPYQNPYGFSYGALPGVPATANFSQPSVVSPMMSDEDDLDDVAVQMYPGLSTTAMPAFQMPTAGSDCGCGSSAGYGGMPAGYGSGTQAAPAVGYGGMPVGYGSMPTGYAGAQTGMPVGYGGMPTGYGGTSMGLPAGYANAPMGMPMGYGGMPTGHDGIIMGMPEGLGNIPTGFPAGFEQPGYPYGQFQAPMPPSTLGVPPLRDDNLEEDDSDW